MQFNSPGLSPDRPFMPTFLDPQPSLMLSSVKSIAEHAKNSAGSSLQPDSSQQNNTLWTETS